MEILITASIFRNKIFLVEVRVHFIAIKNSSQAEFCKCHRCRYCNGQTRDVAPICLIVGIPAEYEHNM